MNIERQGTVFPASKTDKGHWLVAALRDAYIERGALMYATVNLSLASPNGQGHDTRPIIRPWYTYYKESYVRYSYGITTGLPGLHLARAKTLGSCHNGESKTSGAERILVF